MTTSAREHIDLFSNVLRLRVDRCVTFDWCGDVVNGVVTSSVSVMTGCAVEMDVTVRNGRSGP